jgi:hypothetical protein
MATSFAALGDLLPTATTTLAAPATTLLRAEARAADAAIDATLVVVHALLAALTGG